MKTAERIVMVALLLILVGGCAWIYFSVQVKQQEVLARVARGDYNIPVSTEKEEVQREDWQIIYPGTIPVMIGEAKVLASVADTLPTRIKGLSNTPFLPDNVVKIFAFGTAGEHSIWMKNMNYPIDIIWADEAGIIVHIEENISPDTYPESFSSPVPAWFVVETNAGFVSENSIKIGDEVILNVLNF